MIQDNNKATTDLASDAPLNDIQADKFSRSEFSRRVAEVIAQRNDSSSIVIGIYGQWGDGKTTVLNFIAKSLENNNDVICVHFNPWRFGNEDVLLKSFFDEIATALDSKLNTREDTLKSISKKILEPISQLAGIGGKQIIVAMNSFFISMPEIEEFKKRAERLLKEKSKKVLIIIDDIDRLDKDEIFSLFRLVKLTANFKNITYILAFDKDIVASSLQSRYGGSTASGEEFLEKIIQVPLHLPHIQKEVLVKYCLADIDRVLKNFDFNLNTTQKNDLTLYFERIFDSYITTPRKAKQYTNAITFALPLLRGEVDIVDLMLLEALRVFCPEVYDFIKLNKGDLLIGVSDEEKDKYNDLLPRVLNKSKMFDLLKDLFPKKDKDYLRRQKKVCTEEYFDKYFLYSTPRNKVSESDYNRLRESLRSWDESDTSNPLRNSKYSDDIEKWLDKIIFHLAYEKDEVQVKLVQACCQISHLYHPDNPIKTDKLCHKITAVISTYLEKNQGNITEKENVIIKCLDLGSIVVTTEMYNLLDKRNLPSIREAAKDKIKKFIEDNSNSTGENIFDKNRYLPSNTKCMLYILDNRKIATNYVKCKVKEDGFLINMFDFLIRKSVFNDNDYSTIKKYFNVDEIYSFITQQYPNIAESNREDLILLRGFCTIHQQKCPTN